MQYMHNFDSLKGTGSTQDFLRDPEVFWRAVDTGIIFGSLKVPGVIVVLVVFLP